MYGSKREDFLKYAVSVLDVFQHLWYTVVRLIVVP